MMLMLSIDAKMLTCVSMLAKATPLKFGDVLRNVGARHRMLHSLYVFISLSNALVSTTPEAAPAFTIFWNFFLLK